MPVIMFGESKEQVRLDRIFKYFFLPFLCITVCFAIWMIFLALNPIPQKASSFDTIEASIQEPANSEKQIAALKAIKELRSQ